MARVATPPPSVSVPAASAASPAATAPTAAPGRLAVMVPVAVSVLAGAFATVLLAGHAHTVVLGGSFPRVQPLVQTAGLQVMPAVKETKKRTQINIKTRTRARR